MAIKILRVPFFLCLYYFILFNIPWHSFPLAYSISSSYLWDLCFVLLLYFIIRRKGHFPWIKKLLGVRFPPQVAISFFLIILTAFLSLWLGRLYSFDMPFVYLQAPFLQIVILAPIIEELLYRGAWGEVLENTFSHPWFVTFLNAIMFSLSHLPGAYYLPEEFHSFIILQVFYTFFLGLWCWFLRKQTGGLLAPYLGHLLFNLIFYFSLDFV